MTPGNDVEAGTDVEFTCQVATYTPDYYTWYIDGVWALDTLYHTIISTSVTPDQSGTFTCMVTIGSGSSWISEAIHLNVYGK